MSRLWSDVMMTAEAALLFDRDRFHRPRIVNTVVELSGLVDRETTLHGVVDAATDLDAVVDMTTQLRADTDQVPYAEIFHEEQRTRHA